MAETPQALYRLLDAEQTLLYVGVTTNTERRFAVHARDKGWWSEVAERRIEWYSDRKSALAAEREAIHAESPRHNAIHTGRARTPTDSVHPHGPVHTVRVSDEVWKEAQRLTKAIGMRDGVSQLLREFTAWYAGEPGAKLPKRPPAGT